MNNTKKTARTFPPWDHAGLSNLHLENRDISKVAAFDANALPENYSLRTTDFNEKDAIELADALGKAFGIQHGHWDVPAVYSRLQDDKTVKKTFVIEYKGQIVATASARVLEDRFPGAGYLHWVGVHPDHQGKGLSKHLVAAVIQECREVLGFNACVLETQDTSLPAISLYLKFGFLPVYDDDSHATRWRVICYQLEVPFASVDPASRS